jgi:predicted TIM-barrel fold metal-dependent hydrolase
MKLEEMVIVSVDDHAVEPAEAFIRHYPQGKKERAPRIIDRNGKDAWLWCDRVYPTIGLNAVVGRPRSEYGMEPTRFEQLRRGCYDPAARVDDMNVNGILSSLNFPTMPGFAGGSFVRAQEKDDALLAIRAWNDWHVLEWCASAPGRFIPMIILPLWDMQLTLAEMRRMSAHGVHAISFPDNPALAGLPSLHDAYWEPFWKECCDLAMVLNCHIGTGVNAAHASDLTPVDAWITTMPMAIANSAADWLFASFWKRYPALRMALSEGGIGWIPYFLERANYTHEHHHEWTFTTFDGESPADLFKRHIITCFIDDRFGLQNLEFMNVDMICYEADYPHSDTLWPNCPEYLWASLAKHSDDVIDKITHQNALRLYNFDALGLVGGREKANVAALRHAGRNVDVTPRANLGGLKSEGMDSLGGARRPITSGEIMRMFASA